MTESPESSPNPHLLQEAIDIISSEFNRPTEFCIDYEKESASKTTIFTVEVGEERKQYVLTFDGSNDEDPQPTIDQL